MSQVTLGRKELVCGDLVVFTVVEPNTRCDTDMGIYLGKVLVDMSLLGMEFAKHSPFVDDVIHLVILPNGMFRWCRTTKDIFDGWAEAIIHHE